VLVSANTLVTVPHINPQAGYAVKEFTAVGEMVRSPMLLVTSGASPFKSLADLIAAAKKHPGAISFGTSGIGTTNHLGVALLARQAGVSFNHVPYKGITAAVPDVAAGRVAFMMGAPNSAAALLQSGALRALAISAEKRSPKFTDIPTVKEFGFPDAIFEVWIGAVAPAAIPRPVRARLGEAMEVARNDQDLLRRLEGLGQEVSAVRTPDQFDAVLRADEEKLRKLIRDTNIVAE
jgi:tripartite-type tricarboxylate transporter receptor subunit TctC